jgi:hypothetical protein
MRACGENQVWRLVGVLARFRVGAGLREAGNVACPLVGGLRVVRAGVSGADEGLDLLERGRESIALGFEVVASLEVQPESLGGIEVPREP